MFKFNKEGHYYELNGKRLYGVTNVLSVIAKPALIQWSANEAVKHIKSKLPDSKLFTVTKAEMDEWLEEARYAHKKKKEKAGETGTDAHSLIEDYVKDCILKGQTYNMETTDEMVQNFVNWASENEVKFLASEKQLYSESKWVAGTADMVLEIGGKKYVGDVKTSSAIYPEHFYQMAGYRMMLEEMGETDFSGSVVIRIGKDGKFDEERDVRFRYDYETDLNAFLGALAIFKAGETYK